MNKRERVLSLLDGQRRPDRTPAAFFLHFDPQHHFGQASVEKHLEYFRATDMDFVKIQYERTFPPREIRAPDEWAALPRYGREFFQPQLDAVAGLVQAAKAEAVVVVTLYSPFMCAGQIAGSDVLLAHLRSAPEEVRPGLEAITASLLWFVRQCIALGVDGFYASTQGGERTRLGGSSLFRDYVQPYDRAVMEELNRRCAFNILHVCDYSGPYDDLTPFLDYPGHVVSYPLRVAGKPLTGREAAQLFGRPVFGGLDRHGILVTGSPEELGTAVREVLAGAPDRFILGADCTLPSDIDWARIRLAVDTAHAAK